jgi:hypothetical protein
MLTVSSGSGTKYLDDVAQLLSQVVDIRASPCQASEFIEEISQLLWAVSSLDPDAENLLKPSDYLADLVAQSRR